MEGAVKDDLVARLRQMIPFPQGSCGAPRRRPTRSRREQVDGKGPSIWDLFAHNDRPSHERRDGRRRLRHYHRYREDVALMASSVSARTASRSLWTRVAPRDRPGERGGSRLLRPARGRASRARDEPTRRSTTGNCPRHSKPPGWPERSIVDAFAEYESIVAPPRPYRVRKSRPINERTSSRPRLRIG